ncbi:MAG TPA: WD40 repeat domain-containing protein [Polyangia bacterium]|nr:WD40 repeat domain-containing protein [Polyangia bacterium]
MLAIQEQATLGPIVFSADGRLLVSGSVDGTTLVYEADPWWEPGHEPKRPEPVPIDIKPVPEARSAGAGEADEQF